jgi:hypothetical protein
MKEELRLHFELAKECLDDKVPVRGINFLDNDRRENATVNGLSKCAGLLRKRASAKTQNKKNSVKKC